jgi:hypothetical protein
MGAPCRSGMGVKVPGPLRGDGFGDHRVHDILLRANHPVRGAAIEIVFEGYDSLAAYSSVTSLMSDPNRSPEMARPVG